MTNDLGMRVTMSKALLKRAFFLANFFIFLFSYSQGKLKMSILINSISLINLNKPTKSNNKKVFDNYSQLERLSAAKIPSSAIKSKYLPSFGSYRKVDNVTLLDRDSGFNVKASLAREKIGDFVSYKVFVNRQEAGFMHMNCASLFPEGDYVLTQPNNVIPEITHLRSLLGKKYGGIGTALVNAAVKESRKRGHDGCLFLTTEKGYARIFSNYRSNENPIPFYYKLGFEAVNPKVHNLIKECLASSEYNKLPDSALLLLTPEAIAHKNKYFSKNYTFC